eukprot:TRINITY_DN1527_c0_g1_i1.p1 TRINITY_DN1527_c0_g1~~TRINITY_DN1527_c0_g1_i1.p1  ORF type:complete len:637 (+),score=134.29 TRINITY_DN1527_c0_g1_i1:141-2051(+)
MERYTVMKQIGDGTYGSVMKAVQKQSQEVVAIKRFKQKFYTWEECVNLNEVQALRKLNHHQNIVKLREVIREHNNLFFVFEFMDCDLLHAMKEAALGGLHGLPHGRIRNVVYQVLQALTYMHKIGFMHRDLKPENILLKGDVTKLADFGLAKEIRSRPPFTEYVSTRWYRAPEVLLQHKAYNSPIDIWAMGCIIAELYTLRPLFPGSSERDEIFKITSVLGTPDGQRVWPEGVRLAKQMGFSFPQMVSTPLTQLVPSGGREAIDLMQRMLVWDPEKRPKASVCLSHAFFQVVPAGEQGFLLQASAPKAPTSAPAANAVQQQERRAAEREDAQLKPATTGKYKNQIDISQRPRTSSSSSSSASLSSSDSDFDAPPAPPIRQTSAKSRPTPPLPQPARAALKPPVASPVAVNPFPRVPPSDPPPPADSWAKSAAPRGRGSASSHYTERPFAPFGTNGSQPDRSPEGAAPQGPASVSSLGSTGSFTSRARYLPGMLTRAPDALAKPRRTSVPRAMPPPQPGRRESSEQSARRAEPRLGGPPDALAALAGLRQPHFGTGLPGLQSALSGGARAGLTGAPTQLPQLGGGRNQWQTAYGEGGETTLGGAAFAKPRRQQQQQQQHPPRQRNVGKVDDDFDLDF